MIGYDMNIQVEDKRERGKVEVSNTPLVEVGNRVEPTEAMVEEERATVEVGNVEAKAESGTSVPIAEGRVSLYRSALSARSLEKVDILSFLCSDKYKEAITTIRATTDPDRRRELKRKHLPAITPAGVFSPQRGKDYLHSYSAMLGIDIDGKDNPHVEDWSSMAHRIGRECPSVVYAGLSAGGNGCFVLYRVATPQRYAEHYTEIVAGLQRLNLNPDTACKDLARLRYASYDPAPYLNREATPHHLPAEPQPLPLNGAKEAISRPQRGASDRVSASTFRANKRGNPQYLLPRIERAVATLVERGINIAEQYRDDWWPIGCALASTYGEQGRRLFHAISTQSSKYKSAECDWQYNQCMQAHSIGIGTLLRYFKKVGVRW